MFCCSRSQGISEVVDPRYSQRIEKRPFTEQSLFASHVQQPLQEKSHSQDLNSSREIHVIAPVTREGFIQEISKGLEKLEEKQEILEAVSNSFEALQKIDSYVLYVPSKDSFDEPLAFICRLKGQKPVADQGKELKFVESRGFANVFKCKLPSGEEIALKIAQSEKNLEYRSKVMEEAENLRKVHEKGLVEGIQPEPIGYIYAYDGAQFDLEHPVGFLGPYYSSGHLEQLFVTLKEYGRDFLSTAQVVSVMQKLFKASAELRSRNFYNTDMKWENVFLDAQKQEGSADLKVVPKIGGLFIRDIGEQATEKRVQDPAQDHCSVTPLYISEENCNTINRSGSIYRCLGEWDLDGFQDLRAQEKAALEEVMVRHLGFIAASVLFNDVSFTSVKMIPKENGESKITIVHDFNKPLPKNENVEEPIRATIEQMLQGTIGFEEAKARWDGFIAKPIYIKRSAVDALEEIFLANPRYMSIIA